MLENIINSSDVVSGMNTIDKLGGFTIDRNYILFRKTVCNDLATTRYWTDGG